MKLDFHFANLKGVLCSCSCFILAEFNPSDACRDDKILSRIPVAIIQSWYQRRGYVKSMADLIEKELQTFGSPEEASSFSDCLCYISEFQI